VKLLTKLSAAAAVCVFAATICAQVRQDKVAKIEKALPDKAPAKPKEKRKLLIYSKTLEFRHGSIPVGSAAIQMMGEKTGAYVAEHSEDPAMFDEPRLSRFDAVLFLNTTGTCLAPKTGKLTKEEEATLEQRKQNLLKFVTEQGKGFAGFHSAADTFYSWKDYGYLLGAYFQNHPWGQVPIKVDSPNHPLTGMFNKDGFQINDEIYQFGPSTRAGVQPYSRDKLRILLSIDASKFKGKGARPDQDYGISWIHTVGKGRAFYCALGHSEEMYWHPDVLRHYLAGLQYVLGDLSADATPSGPLPGSKQ
jgi:type 1 glutamine amidotransferase